MPNLNSAVKSAAIREPSSATDPALRSRIDQPCAHVRNPRSKQPTSSNSGKSSRSVTPQKNWSTHDRTTPCDPPVNSRTAKVAFASQSVVSQSERESKSMSTVAVVSAGTGLSELFDDSIIDGVQVIDIIIDTGSSFSMLTAALYELLPSRPPIRKFDDSAPDVIGVGGASAGVRGYIDVPVQIAGAEVSHPLLVVTDLPFSLLIGMDVLRPHEAKLAFGGVTHMKFGVRVCSICIEHRVELKRKFRSEPIVSYPAGKVRNPPRIADTPFSTSIPSGPPVIPPKPASALTPLFPTSPASVPMPFVPSSVLPPVPSSVPPPLSSSVPLPVPLSVPPPVL